jgi:CelD/BcsL family acetyltransferase involved in cellulose biosynthesis
MVTALKLRDEAQVPHHETARPLPAPPNSQLSPGLRGLDTRVCQTLALMDALAPDWMALERHAATPVFFQSQSWSRHVVATVLGNPACGTIHPFILSVWLGRELIAVWPLQLTGGPSARVLTDLTAPFGQYADILMADGQVLNGMAIDPEDLCRWMIGRARRISRADALVLRKVRADTPLGRVLAREAGALHAGQRAPYVSMAGFAAFEAFHASTKAKTRKNVRNATHRLEKLGAITHKVERRSVRMDAALSHCFDLRSTWLDEKGLVSTAFSHPAFGALVRGLADTGSHEIDVLSMMLMLDDKPISIHYGFLHNRRYYAFMAGRDPAYDACSPGKVHLEHVLAACFAQGAETVDLLAPEMPYKLVWASESVETEDYGLTWSIRGWLAINVWRRRVRPLSRKAFLALPEMVRQRLARRLRA